MPEREHLMERIQCGALAKGSRKRCKRYAIAGGTVCELHGGAAIQVRKPAAERLRQLQHPAIEALAEAIANGRTGDAVKAAVAVLDRTGLGPHSTQDVNLSAQQELARRIQEADSDISATPSLPSPPAQTSHPEPASDHEPG